MTLDYEEIGRNIKLCRIKKQLKRAQLAEIVGVSSQHISHIEYGRTKLGLPLLLHISEVLSTNLYTLLGDNVLDRPDSSVDTRAVKSAKRCVKSAASSLLGIMSDNNGI